MIQTTQPLYNPVKPKTSQGTSRINVMMKSSQQQMLNKTGYSTWRHLFDGQNTSFRPSTRDQSNTSLGFTISVSDLNFQKNKKNEAINAQKRFLNTSLKLRGDNKKDFKEIVFVNHMGKPNKFILFFKSLANNSNNSKEKPQTAK